MYTLIVRIDRASSSSHMGVGAGPIISIRTPETALCFYDIMFASFACFLERRYNDVKTYIDICSIMWIIYYIGQRFNFWVKLHPFMGASKVFVFFN